MLVVLSATFGVVSASEYTMESALSSVDESYTGDGETLSLSSEESVQSDGTLSLSGEESIQNDETLSLSNEEKTEDSNKTLSLSNEGSADGNTELLGWGEPVKTTSDGCDYVQLSNGYTAFCANRQLTFPKTGTDYFTAQQYILTHDKRVGERIDNKLRLAIVHYADNPQFHEKIKIPEYTLGAFSRTQQLMWYLSNFDELAPYSMKYLDRDPILRDAYNDIINRHNRGEWIDEDRVTYNNGTHEITYEFSAFKSGGSYQTLIGYKKIIKEIPPTPKNPGMAVNKKSLTPNVMAGQQTQFLITVWNTGDIDLGNVFVKESVPAGLEYADYSNKDLWRKDGDTFYYNNILKVGQSANFTIIFNTNMTGSFINCVVAGSNETENKYSNNTTTVYKPGIDVQKLTITPAVLVGDQAKFEIVVKNTGDIPLHNVILEETSYDGLIYDSFTDNGLWTHSVVNGKNVWTLNKALNVNEIVNLFVNFNTVTVGNFTNIVTVGSNETKNKIANNTTIVYNNTEPVPEQSSSNNSDISIEKTALNKVVVIGNQAVFEIIVTNTGEVVLHDVTVSEDSFNGLVYDSWYDNTGLWTKNRDLTWTMNSPLFLGETASFYVVFNTTKTGEFTNIVSVDSKETDKKSAKDTVEVIKPDFAVEKIAVNKTVFVGEQVMFEILVQNVGQMDLNNVVVREDSFNGLIYDSFIDYNGLWTKNSDLSWNLNVPLAVGEYAGFFVTFNTTSAGNFVNVVSASSDKTQDKHAKNTTTVIDRPVPVVPEKPVTPEEPVPVVPEEPVTPEEPVPVVNDSPKENKTTPDKNETTPAVENKPVSKNISSVAAGNNATGNPLVLILLSLLALVFVKIRRKN